MENIDPSDFLKSLNEQLQASYQDNLTFSFSPDQLKEYLIASLAKGYKAQAGTIEVDKDDKIAIRKIQFNIPKSMGGTVTFDLIISSNPDGIAANIQNYGGGLRARGVRGKVEGEIKAIDSTIKKYLDEKVALENSLWTWTTKNISISKGRILIRFEYKKTRT